ncbi:MAG TPA: hypothetical protein VGC79_06165, partial [Polyangiaceae bacterium]
MLLVSNCGARVERRSDAHELTAGADGQPAAGAGGVDDGSADGHSTISDGGQADFPMSESCTPACPDTAFCAEDHCHPRAVGIGAGYTDACAVLIDHSTRCWGAGHPPLDWAQD